MRKLIQMGFSMGRRNKVINIPIIKFGLPGSEEIDSEFHVEGQPYKCQLIKATYNIDR